jgi:alpha-N-acetylglucosaminidase
MIDRYRLRGAGPAQDAVRALARRVMDGGSADQIDVHRLDDVADGGGAFAYQATDGQLSLRATDTSAACAGLYHYLKHVCRVQVTWDDPHPVDLSGRLPDSGLVRRSTPVKMRYYLNVVTTGYSAPFWDWSRWERELDWMALHGINMPLVVVGHETVLKSAFIAAGAEESDVVAWLGGSPYLPWTLMGSTNAFGGPLPRSWFAQRAALARRILGRARELGMRPVLPAFGGHVPDSLAKPDTPRTTWQDFTTALLDPEDPRFALIAERVVSQQRDLYGTDHLYAADPFIESVPPAEDPAALAAIAAATYRGMSSGDPEATWVMQAWPFHYHRRFWNSERVAAVTGAVPAGRLILLDLWAEHAPVWNDGRGVASHPWLWCAVHNFGGRPSVHGDLAALSRDLGAVVDATSRKEVGMFTGVGIATEAIENNPIFYELLTDLVWDRADLDQWIRDYVARRYRLYDHPAAVADHAYAAWDVLLATLYGPGMTRSIPSPLIARPWQAEVPFRTQRRAGEALDPKAPMSANVDAEAEPRVEGDLPAIAGAARDLLAVVASTGGDGTAAEDLVDVLTHLAAQRARVPIRSIVAAAENGDAKGVRMHGEALDRAVADVDTLAATRSGRLLGRWLADAASWGDSAAEQMVQLRDARRILTVWGRQSSGLHDYSGRHWAGLADTFYRPRWALWTEWLARAIDENRAPEPGQLHAAVVALEEAWVARADIGETKPRNDLARVANELLQRYTHPLPEYRPPVDQ